MIVAQISDFHVRRRIAYADGDVDTLERLERAVRHVQGLRPAPDLVVATGDLANDATAAEYAAVHEALSRLDMPFYVIPGNHDDRSALAAAFAADGYLPAQGDFLHYVVEEFPLRLIMLDTTIPGEDSGEMCDRRLAWLEARLAEAPERPTVIFMHHPPFASGPPFFDRLGLAGGDAVGAIVAGNRQVEAVLCGHVHRAIDLGWRGTLAATTPGTAFQYPLEMADVDDVDPVREPAACRVCVWTPEGGLVTHLSFIE